MAANLQCVSVGTGEETIMMSLCFTIKDMEKGWARFLEERIIDYFYSYSLIDYSFSFPDAFLCVYVCVCVCVCVIYT